MKFLKKIKRWIEVHNFHIIKTLFLNIRLLPFRQAIHLPLVVYGNTQIKLSRSKVILNSFPKFGMMKLGYQNDWQMSQQTPSLFVMINGTLEIGKNVMLAPGVTVRVHEGKIYLGSNVFIGGGTKLLSNNDIAIHDNTMVAFGCVICDTNFHYMHHDKIIEDCNGSVLIGENCWIGNSSTVMKGTNLPNNTIVGSKAYVNKDWSKINPGTILVGSPATPKKDGYYIVPKEEEGKLRQYFKNSPQTICFYDKQ